MGSKCCMKILCLFTIMLMTLPENYADFFESQSDMNTNSKVLSRRKRFVIFPDGSSFQLVFCTQTHGYLQVGDIVWFGSTAALAWELPTDPGLFQMFKDQKTVYGANRRSDVSKHIYYLDEDGKVISKMPYHKRPIVNPAFAKRSTDYTMAKKNIKKFSVKDMHNKSKNISYFNNLHENSIDFHREGRKNLYVKLEKFFQGLGWNGRQCVLRILCETGKAQNKQGTFLEEIMRATFTLPEGRGFDTAVHKEYDNAHGTSEDCAEVYPGCEDLHGVQLFEKH